MFTEAQIRAAIRSIPDQQERYEVMDLGGVHLVRTPAYVNGTGAGEIADLQAQCPDSEIVEWPAGFIGTSARSMAFAMRTRPHGD